MRKVRLVTGIFSLAVVLVGACGGDPTTSSDTPDGGAPSSDGGAPGSDSSTPPAPATFTVGGTVSGLIGAGLTLQNGADVLAVTADGAFTFPTKVKAGATFAVTVKTQAAGQTCVVTGGTGTVVAGDVTSVAVACTKNTFTVGGSVTGLAGTGLVLENAGSTDLPVNMNGAFAFAPPVTSGTAYAVKVKTQPTNPVQTCTVAAGAGAVGTANVTNVAVTCKTPVTIGGDLSGLLGTGLVLQNNGADDLPLAANGPFKFTTLVLPGQPYAVTVKTSPANPNQKCVVTKGSGNVAAAAVTDVAVDCATTRTSCKAILDAGESVGSGLYTVLAGAAVQTVYCDMTSDGGGWTLIVLTNGGIAGHPNVTLAEAKTTFSNVNGALSADLDNFDYFMGTTFWTGVAPGGKMLFRVGTGKATIQDMVRNDFVISQGGERVAFSNYVAVLGGIPNIDYNSNGYLQAKDAKAAGAGSNCTEELSAGVGLHGPWFYQGCSNVSPWATGHGDCNGQPVRMQWRNQSSYTTATANRCSVHGEIFVR